MGTSTSSKGPTGGVPFDPPWINDLTSQHPGNEISPEDHEINTGNVEIDGLVPLPPSLEHEIAPLGRFSSARRALSVFTRTGDKKAFTKAVGHYSRKGYGGAFNIAKRMRLSTSTAVNLFTTLQSARNNTDQTVSEWVASLLNRNALVQEIVSEIIIRIAPSGGSQDETSCRESMAQALEDLLEEYPSINLFNLVDGDIWKLIESFLSYEAFNRLCLDIGQIFENQTLSAQERVQRMNEMHSYLKSELYTQIEAFRQTSSSTATNQLQILMQNALQNTFLVYEGTL